MGKETKEELQLLTVFQQACNSLKRGEEYDESLKKRAEETLGKSNCLGLRKLAAELLYRAGQVRRNWLGLAAAADVGGPSFLIALVRRWLRSYGENSQIGSSTDEFLFYSKFIEKISKERQLVRKELDKDDFSDLKRNLLFVALTLSELRNENYTSLFKAVVKLNKNDEELLEMAGICQEIGLYLPGNLLLTSLISKESREKLPLFDDWLSAIPIWPANQELASAASPLISEFLRHHLKQTVETIVPLLISKNPAISGSVLRCWLQRWPKEPRGLDAIQLILKCLEERCEEQFNKPKEPYWPPKLEYFEDFTCIDPEWNWEESPGVTWPEDRLLTAFLAVWETFYEKFTMKKAKETRLSPENRFMKCALVWHDEEIRNKAEKVLRLIGGEPQEAQKSKKVEKEDQPPVDKVYVPADLEVPEIPKEEPKLVEFVDDLLMKHGSEKEDRVPLFPTVHLRFKEFGINERAFVKQMSDSIDLVVSSQEILKEKNRKAEFLWNIVTRTRVKAIVDSGCSALEELFEKEKTLTDDFFPKLVDYLLCPKTEVRTLVLSRLLWSCCQNNGPYFVSFWEKIQPCLSLTTDPSTLARILKTVKHFVSQNDCQFPDSSYPILFSFCLEVQNSSNFLARSAATIVFGFLLKRITARRKLPLFVLIGIQKTLWNQWRDEKFHNLSSLPQPQRILLLTLLRKYIIVHTEFYSDYELKTISRLLYQVNLLRAESPDIRERRFCVDVLFQLSPPAKQLKLQEMMSHEENLNSREDQYYLRYRMEQMDGKPKESAPLTAEQIVSIAGLSNYYQFQQKHYELIRVPPRPRRILREGEEDSDEDMGVSAPEGSMMGFFLKPGFNNRSELAVQNFVMAEEASVWLRPEDYEQDPFRDLQYFGPYDQHPLRVQSLLSRLPVAAGKVSFYKNVNV